MNGRWFPKVASALVAVVLIIGIAYAAFSLGMAQGVASKLPTVSGQAGATPTPYHGWPFWFAGSPFWGFHFLGVLFGFFVLFMVLRLISFAIWGPRWGHWRHAHGGWDEESGVPFRFKEWHDRAHQDAEGDKKS